MPPILCEFISISKPHITILTGTTSVENADRHEPTNVSLVLGRHRKMGNEKHGIEIARKEKGGEAKYRKLLRRDAELRSLNLIH